MKLYRFLPFLILITVFTSGCGPLHPSTTLRTPSQPVITEEAYSQPTASPVPTENTFIRPTATPVSSEAVSTKMDVYVFEGVDPARNLADAVKQFYADYSTEQEITSMEELTFGPHPALLVTVTRGLSGGTVNRLVYFRLAPDKLLWFIFYPDTALDSPDAQAIMNSLVLPLEGEFRIPEVAPGGGPDDGSLSCP